MTLSELALYLEQKDELSADEEVLLKEDKRRGAAELLNRFYRRRAAGAREQKRLERLLVEEKALWQEGCRAVAGVDEAGRGPLAGPVVAAAVIFNPGNVVEGLNDSKQLTAKAREKLFEQIIIKAFAYGLGSASRAEIDSLNIHAASMLAMRRALASLPVLPDYILVDGFPIRDCPSRQKAIRGGDARSLSIAAASILAKVSRDRLMVQLHRRYPRYGFDRNKGYATADHCRALTAYGPCPAHRQSFRLDY